MVWENRVLEFLVRPKHVLWVLMKTKVKGIKVDRIEMKVYKNLNKLYIRWLQLFCLVIL